MTWVYRSMLRLSSALVTCLDTLIATFDESPDELAHVYTNACYIKSQAHAWSDLPQRGELYEIRTPLTVCRGYLNRIQIMAEKKELSYTSQQFCYLDTTLSLLRTFEYWFNHLIDREAFGWFVKLDTDHEPSIEVGPLLISHLLAWPIIQKMCYQTGTSLITPDETLFAPVLYDPDYTPICWRAVVTPFIDEWRNQAPLYITPYAESEGIAIRITRPGLLMEPARWALILLRLSAYKHERLRELGGSLMPLTWDEGYGQGIVLRLPWANK